MQGRVLEANSQAAVCGAFTCTAVRAATSPQDKHRGGRRPSGLQWGIKLTQRLGPQSAGQLPSPRQGSTTATSSKSLEEKFQMCRQNIVNLQTGNDATFPVKQARCIGGFVKFCPQPPVFQPLLANTGPCPCSAAHGKDPQ